MFSGLPNFPLCQHFLYYRKRKRYQNVLSSRKYNPWIRQTNFSGIYIHFGSFLPSTYKIAMIHTLLYRCFWICSDWTKFYLELVELMVVFKSNRYRENFINNCFQTFLDNKQRMQEKVITVHEEPSTQKPSTISSVNVTKSAVSCGFGHI